MNCAEARFLLYAYLDREMSRAEESALDQHVAACPRCALRARSARGLAQLLHSQVFRANAPERLRLRVYNGTHYASPSRAGVLGMAAAVALLIVPLVADGVPERRPEAFHAASAVGTSPVSRNMTGTLVCLHCEALRESGLEEAPERPHEPGFCTQEGEVWRLLDPPSGFTKASIGQTMTVEGVAFPQSGFLRASRAGY
ncbi:MAG: anti-sigma factor family protein [Thermoanaerobaculia bacterium]